MSVRAMVGFWTGALDQEGKAPSGGPGLEGPAVAGA